MRIESAGVRLHVEVEGPQDATPVVLLHGVSGSSRVYAWLPPAITDGRRLVRVDFRGHGRSGHAAGTYRIDRYAGDVVAVLRALAGRPAVLVGHSLGGVAAWWVAQRHPELVAAALLEDPPLYLAEPEEHARNPVVESFPGMRDRAAAWQREGVTVAVAVEQLARSSKSREVVHEGAIVAEAQAHLSMDPEVLTAAADGSALAATDTTAPVTVPVVILAADDRLGAAFTTAHERRLARTHPDVAVVRVAGARHEIKDGRATRETYLEQLARFLDRYA